MILMCSTWKKKKEQPQHIIVFIKIYVGYLGCFNTEHFDSAAVSFYFGVKTTVLTSCATESTNPHPLTDLLKHGHL